MSNCCSDNCSSTFNEIDSIITLSDYWNDLIFRIGIKRNDFVVKPGLYRLGNPKKDSKVFVTANFTMSFNRLRKALRGEDAWIMIIDTKGINVWCAAGKGTFGTEEIIDKIKKFKLYDVVDTRELVLPQLGAPGVDSNRLKKETGFKVLWGPVHTRDLKRYIDNSYKKDEKMMKVTFNLFERLAVSPLEMVHSFKYVLVISLALLVIHGVGTQGIIWKDMLSSLPVLGGVLLSWLTGTLFFPALLPLLPLRSFAIKGFYLSTIVSGIYNNYVGIDVTSFLYWGSMLLYASFSSFWALNFTGCSTFTSPRGVEKELKMFLKPILVLTTVGFIVTALVGLEIIS